MLIYSLFYLLITVTFLFHRKVVPSQRKILLALFFLALILFAGLRGSVGSDTPGYAQHFQLAADADGARLLLLQVEPAFVSLLYFLRQLSESSLFFIFSYSLIQSFIIWRIYSRIEKKLFILIYVLLFYVQFHFNTLRAGTATLLLLYSLVEDRRSLKYLAIILAPGFHASILIFYPFFVFKPNFKNFAIAAIAILLSYLFLSDLIIQFYEKGAGYSDYGKYLQKGYSTLSIIFTPYILLSILLIKNASLQFKLSGVALILSYLLGNIFPIAYRLIIISQVFYFYFMLESLNNNLFEKVKLFVFWPFFSILFALNLLGIMNEGKNLEFRVNSGELPIRVFNSTTIPYKLYWNDPNVRDF